MGCTVTSLHNWWLSHDNVIKLKSPTQRPVTRSLDVFFDLRLKKRLSKSSRLWSFKTPSRSLWRHCNHCSRSRSLSVTSTVYWCVTSNFKFSQNSFLNEEHSDRNTKLFVEQNAFENVCKMVAILVVVTLSWFKGEFAVLVTRACVLHCL